MLDAMRAFKAPAADIERAAEAMEQRKAQYRAQDFGVYRDNWRTVKAWLALETQWQHAGMAGLRVGLNYAGMHAWLQIHERPRLHRQIASDLALMERAALQALGEIRQEKE